MWLFSNVVAVAVLLVFLIAVVFSSSSVWFLPYLIIIHPAFGGSQFIAVNFVVRHRIHLTLPIFSVPENVTHSRARCY